MAESEEELKSLLMKVKEKSEKAGLKLNIQNTRTMASSPMQCTLKPSISHYPVHSLQPGTRVQAEAVAAQLSKPLAVPCLLSICLSSVFQAKVRQLTGQGETPGRTGGQITVGLSGDACVRSSHRPVWVSLVIGCRATWPGQHVGPSLQPLQSWAA